MTTEIFTNKLYDFLHDERNNVLIFRWTELTANMTDDDFIEALSNYAGFAFELGGPGLLVDVRNFRHRMGEVGMKWRNEEGLKRYLAAGSNKMAYLMSDEMRSKMPDGEVPIGKFRDRYFSAQQDAIDWLSEE